MQHKQQGHPKLPLAQFSVCNDVLVCVSGQLKANNAQLMEEAVQAMQNLAQQCSDPTAVQDIVTHLFKILGGELTDASLNELLSESGFAFDRFNCNSSVRRF